MMELTDSTHEKPEPTPSVIGIDLNEIPSPSSSDTLSPDAFAVVRTYQDHPTPSAGDPAEVPGDSYGSTCGACGQPEVRGHVVVCDGCERGFHLRCAGMQGRMVGTLDEWMCGTCMSNGVASSRWPLGSKWTVASGQKHAGVCLLDTSSLPLCDGEGGDGEKLRDSRKQIPGDNSFGGNPFGAPVTLSNLLYARKGNGLGFQKASGVVTPAVKSSFEDVFHRTKSAGSNFEEVDMHSLLGRFRNSNHTAIRLPHWSPSERHMQALRDIISERHGVLEEGWHVEFKPSTGSGELHAFYCAPDGKTFESIPEVACYLGLTSNSNFIEPEARDNGSAPFQRRMNLSKRQKSGRLLMANGVVESNGTLMSGLCGDLSSDFHTNVCANKLGDNVKVMEARPEENSGTGPQQLNDGLPVQYEDFFVLSLGKVDTRSSYHNVSRIWPIGYKSCWHDKITGSLFMCDVLDGGDSGPVFKVTRYSCSALPVPIASTALFRPNLGQSDCQKKEENDEMTKVSMDYDEDCSVQMILSDPSPPAEHDILSCLGSYSNESSNVQMSNCLQLKASPPCESSDNLFSDNSVLRDEIGEFSVEEYSSSSAWRMVSNKLINTCSEIYMQKGSLKFFCKHVENGTCSAYWDITDEENKEKFTSLAKFCSSLCSVRIPSFIQGDSELGTVLEVLMKWLDQDRFGLDVAFVQEIVEQLPDALACSQYIPLNERSYYSSSLTVGNGFLLVKTKGGVRAKDGEALDDDGMLMFEDPVMESHRPPPGKPISSRLPPQLVGDVLQVWEFLWRFHEILGLEEPLSFEELEEELISPWSDGLNLLDKFGRESHKSQFMTSRGTDGTSRHIFSSGSESGSAVSMENAHAFIQVETGAMKEAAQARIASITYSRCTGVTLTKVHNSLLKVLICELQSKVAAVVDPNFDTGESKSKRGKRKDADCLIAAKRMKLSILPINELTWPELARRFILAFLSVDGNLDSSEITIHGSGKLFCCLQGDGGVLCGSLTGVAGMEADALLLAEATKKILGSLNTQNNILAIDDGGSDETSASEKTMVNDGNIPEWAQLLEPVRKLPTNVGARIKRCIYDALNKGPPEWAKNILEHSISKEVYKGNASGPTKKAVLSVLADVYGESLRKKPDSERKKKIFISISDVVMKQCRIVLRRVAVADEAKVFCNLLGRKLLNSSDNDDEGILGTPAMVSRPLDFRTIDLRLAVGAYGGSHEAFLEDVRELWTNVRIAYGDQPDLVQLAETLSRNFELLYEKEVVGLFQKFVQYAKSECLSAASKKEINDFLVSANELPKAPWEEGVCKVCGIDRDDDSVLLCDTCDAEYHTYCLKPPLARIPEGNWYCPSCVAGKHMVQDAKECTSVICQHQKKYQGEVTRVYLDALAHLAAIMEEREYWELNVDERTFLLNFLCDELLNSALIRQHLEQCAEVSVDLQQELRSISVEWRNLKHKEEIFVAKVMVDRFSRNAIGDVGIGEGPAALTNNGKCSEQSLALNSRPNSIVALSDDVPSLEGGKKINDLNRENSFQGDAQINVGRGISTLPSSEDLQGLPLPLDKVSTNTGERLSPMVVNGSAEGLEFNSVRNEISLLQDSISSIEMRLLKLSIRREFLGSDSAGRSYWILARPGTHPWVIVSASMALQQGERMMCCGKPEENCPVSRNSAPYGIDTLLSPGCSGASCSFVHELKDANPSCSPWVSYQSDAEIKELMGCLKDSDPKERELKKSIFHWQKLRFQESLQSGNQDQDEHEKDLSNSTSNENSVSSKCLVTRAASLLEGKYGPCFEPETIELLENRGKKAKVTIEEKMYRCECLEPVWPSRNHCFSCHRTFFTDAELEGHHDANCNSVPPVFEKNKGNSALKGKSVMKFETTGGEFKGEMGTIEAAKNGCSELSSSLIIYQNDRLVCPYDFEDICSKFVTKNSNKELVQEIGLIGSNGIPSFVPSVSPYLSDPTLMLLPPQKDVGVPGDDPKADEQLVFSQGNKMVIDAGQDSITDNSPRIHAPCELSERLKTEKPAFRHLEQKEKKSSFPTSAPVLEAGNCCIVPESSLRPLVGKGSQILRRLKINLLDMDAALPEAAVKPSKKHLERRWAWRAFVKSAETIYEMVQAIIIFEGMIRTEYLRNMWWYWSSLSAAAKISTLSSLALRIYSLDAAIDYENNSFNLYPLEPSSNKPDKKPQPGSNATEKSKLSRKPNKKRKEPEG